MSNSNDKFLQELRNQARSKAEGENFNMTPEVSIFINLIISIGFILEFFLLNSSSRVKRTMKFNTSFPPIFSSVTILPFSWV